MDRLAAVDTNYILTRSEAESDRLTWQYEHVKKALNRETALPPCINPESIETVIDVGAGNLAWTLDLARTPEIRSRLPTSGASADAISQPVHLYACDLSDAQFPPHEVTDALGITLFEHDVTQRFPPELHGKFDIVNMRMLVFALSSKGWEKALANLRELLKPGGMILLLELNALWYRPESEQCGDWSYDPQREVDPDYWVDKCNAATYYSVMEPNGFIIDLVHRLPILLEGIPLTIMSKSQFVTPIGALCNNSETTSSPIVVDEGSNTTANFLHVFETITKNALNNGCLKGLAGPVDCEEERQALVRESQQGMETEGAIISWIEIVAKYE